MRVRQIVPKLSSVVILNPNAERQGKNASSPVRLIRFAHFAQALDSAEAPLREASALLAMSKRKAVSKTCDE